MSTPPPANSIWLSPSPLSSPLPDDQSWPIPSTPPLSLYERASETANYIRERIDTDLFLLSPSTSPNEYPLPKVGIIADSGLTSLGEAFGDIKVEIPYQELDGFVVGNVSGHASTLVYGTLGAANTPAILLSGRAHFYEGHSLETTTFPIRVLKLLGVETVIITNAAGSLNEAYNVGDIVIINDHINLAGLAGLNPLRGPNHEEFGPRFLALDDAYDLDLRRKAHLAWAKCNQVKKLNEGVYAFSAGPCYETRAEIRMLSMLGGDLVGMSTTPEVIVARHSGMSVLALSIVTNCALGNPPPLGDEADVEMHKESGAKHTEVLEATKNVADDVREFIVKIVELIE